MGINITLIRSFPLLGLLLGLLLWMLDAFVDTFLIDHHETWLQSIVSDNPAELWMRTLVVIVIVIASFMAQYFMRKQYQYEVMLLQQQEHLERLVQERTADLQKLADVDELTQLYNRRKFNYLLQNEISRAQRYHTPLSLAIMDIDHFKQVNDHFGHDEGDRVLQAIAQILREHLRDTDIYARWGGEEFIFVLPQTDSRKAEEVARKIHEQISDLTIAHGELRLSASIGISQRHDGEHSDQLLKRADDALYQAKHDGRNRTVIAV